MTNKPKVLIVGRPNVGKSTLINRITGTRKAITAEEEGTTRDVRSFDVTWNGRLFEILDSGGWVRLKKDESMQTKINDALTRYIPDANLILWVVDAMDARHPFDQDIVKLLRPHTDKIKIIANKVDNDDRKLNINDFFKFGFGEPYPVSSIQGTGIADVLDMVVDHFPKKEIEEDDGRFKITFVGRPNVGKSSLLNAIVNDERAIVDNVAGTTRDSNEVYFKHQDNEYVFVDTAGLRRSSKVVEKVEYFSTIRTAESMMDADLVVVVIDAESLLADQDKKIVNEVLKNKRNMIIFVNKWDLTLRTDEARKDMVKICRDMVPALQYYPFLFGSATEKHNVTKLFNMIPELIDRAKKRIGTGELNRFVETVIDQSPPPAKKGRRLKVFYVTQAEVSPPTFVFFVNDSDLISLEYKRFIERRFRDYFGGLEGVPLRLRFRNRGRGKK